MAFDHGVSVPNNWILFSLATVVGSLLLLRVLRKPKTKYHYPPGPTGIPIFGNILQLPPKYPGEKLLEWGKQYGDMFTLQLGARRWVFANSYSTTRELLDRRARLYSGRPEFPVTQDILSGGNRIVMMGNTPLWRNLRKIMHSLLMASNSETYAPFQDVESRTLVWQYLQRPDEFYKHGARFANSVIFSVYVDQISVPFPHPPRPCIPPLHQEQQVETNRTPADNHSVFGRRTSMEDPNVQLLFSTIDDFMETQASPSTSMIEQFPGLVKLLPRALQWYRPKAERVFRKTIGVYASFFDELERRIKQGEDPQCFARDMSVMADKHGFSSAQKYFCAGSIIEAGSDTTRNQINLLLAAAAKYPAWVRTAQAQLDAVCGKATRLPSFDDWHALPYIHATIKESLRWRPNMTTSGTPRALTADDSFGGYTFEAGTVFSYNHYGLSHDGREFGEQHDEFRPERFLDDDLFDPLKGHLGFGVGRRICPGSHLAVRNMFLAFARLLYCFEFEEVPGHEINVLQIDPLAHAHPPFKIRIVPRSEEHVALIERECGRVGRDI